MRAFPCGRSLAVDDRQRLSVVTWTALLGCVVGLATAGCNRDSPGTQEVETSPAAEAPGAAPIVEPVQDLATFAGSMPAEGPIEPEVIAGALRRLAGAAGSASAVPLALTVDLRVYAEHVLLDPESIEVTAAVRETLIRVADTVAETTPGPDAAALQAAATSISARQPLTTQAADLRRYFQAAAAALVARSG
jgi:hypothetical protein